MKNSIWIAVRVFAITFLVLGVGYPLLITGVAGVAMPSQSTGSVMTGPSGTAVGSALLGQAFESPGYFHSRPSAGGYDALVSGGTNLGPASRALSERLASSARAVLSGPSGSGTAPIPADAIASSGSGLDPDISPANALSQAHRVAATRGIDASGVRRLIETQKTGRDLGFIGEPRVNVLKLNLALDRAFPPPR